MKTRKSINKAFAAVLIIGIASVAALIYFRTSNKYSSSDKTTEIDISSYTDKSTKNNLDLVEWAKCAEKAHWGYVWGTYGEILDRTKLAQKEIQYPENVGGYERFIKENWLNGRAADCVGLIKGYCWLNAETLSIDYCTNGTPDINTDTMYETAKEKGEIGTIPEIKGLAVWQKGHIGVYIGDGYVIEAKGTEYGVVKTKLKDGNWTHWLKIPYIEYR